MWSDRQARREGIIGPLVTITDANDSVARQVSNWAEVVEAENYFTETAAYDQSLAPLRACERMLATRNWRSGRLSLWIEPPTLREVSAEVLA